ncbi:phosphotransferase KptA/Tpt1 [Saitoella complicata NRRL Y-17804]|uniref:2'-phosphotransferase n=1 Tax=Saitoella complicata (strain BCRC 22490 / CBS 7301 / JCM 7358 / NBRC 10748 / NRRL Y-17804) TaxID=698492 RepID=A0A0E9NAE1_SAICN|nr:phosphotransferase KptA/Tpt1 [Saitoella complicata NRRL Y-17804]ODQ55863.1 phosphotransferase KptA/Tpt1 [Saitoella complicata NRRL Y-17804]GAO46773.1 hypothetical protein G7K_0994-t1 [Saitoella complicata NRRL Y-17804]
MASTAYTGPQQPQGDKKPRTRGGRGRPNDSPEVQLSKSLSYILRHGAAKEGLEMREDGYVILKDILARPKFKNVTFEEIQHIVETNDKKRYALLPPTDLQQSSPEGWMIRANQGHTLQVESLELSEITEPLPICVHGTTKKPWEAIKQEGLSKMKRNHIHLAVGKFGEEGVISGMRKSCTVFVYVDMKKALEAGIKFYQSANGVVLTEGNAEGKLSPEFFEKVEDDKGQLLL